MLTSIKIDFKKLACLIGIVLLTGCSLKREAVFTGKTMGTVYRVKVVAGHFQKTAHLQQAIDNRLMEINASMSVYQKNSEISRFNTMAEMVPYPISKDFARVIAVGIKLYAQTGGAWDATVGPLVNLWGFGTNKRPETAPDKAKIIQLQATTGFDKLSLLSGPALTKSNPGLSLDLGSIAKGYGVDQIADLVAGHGFTDYLVEIGGEVTAVGRRKDGHPWRIGINTPKKGSSPGDVYKVIRLSNKSMATSGDYRNYFEINGKSYSHVLDPRSGYPVANGVVSVSIIADTCTYADGLATAVMVMGQQAGMDLIRSLDGVEGMIVVKAADGRLANHYSSGFTPEIP